MGDTDDLAKAWRDHETELDRREARFPAAIGAVCNPAFAYVDTWVYPETWSLYLPGRIVFELACIALVLASYRLEGDRLRLATTATFLTGGFFVGLAVPLAGETYPIYIVCYSVIMWAAGSVLALPWRWNLALLGGLALELGLGHLLLGTDQPPVTVLAAAAYIASTFGLTAASVHARHRSRREAFLAQWQLRRRNEELAASRLLVAEERSAREAQSAFLARMSHELRTPLNAILGYAEMAREEVEEAGLAEVAADLGKINEAGEGLLVLLGDILDVTALELGNVPFAPEELDVHEVVRTVVEQVRPAAEQKGLALSFTGDPLEAVHDPARLRQILIALLANAVKYTDQGRIDVRLEGSPDGLLVSVTDTGPGIAPEDAQRIFERFEQVDGTTTRRHDGAGLGLAVARPLARHMGGDLALDTSTPEGSRFTLRLPRAHPG